MSLSFSIAVRVLVVAAATAVPVLAQPCVSKPAGARSATSQHWTNDDDGTRFTRIRWRSGDCELRLEARGQFGVRADLSGFTQVDDYVELQERDGDHDREVRVTTARGALQYRWTLDGDDGFDVDRESWLRDMLLAVERRTAAFAKTRVPLLVKQGGGDAVLGETALMLSDYAKRQYYTVLFATTKLTEPQLGRVLSQAADSMSSDYERAEVVRAVAAHGPMTDALSRGTIAVARRMSSDYEKRRALSAGLDAVASPVSRTALFDVAATMNSSYELAELLIAAQQRSLVDSVSAQAYFDAVSKLRSDYERRRTLSALLRLHPASSAVLAGVLRSSETISSDFELASLLVEFASVTPVRGALRELYIKATRSISSDFEYRRALTALLEQDRRT
jgi:hypothetical protein